MKRFLSCLPLILAVFTLTFLPPILYHLFVALWTVLVEIGSAA